MSCVPRSLVEKAMTALKPRLGQKLSFLNVITKLNL